MALYSWPLKWSKICIVLPGNIIMSFEWLSPHKKDRKDPYYNRPNGIPSVRPLTATFALLAFGEGAKPISLQGAFAPRSYIPQYEVDWIFVAEGSTIPPHPQANCRLATDIYSLTPILKPMFHATKRTLVKGVWSFFWSNVGPSFSISKSNSNQNRCAHDVKIKSKVFTHLSKVKVFCVDSF